MAQDAEKVVDSDEDEESISEEKTEPEPEEIAPTGLARKGITGLIFNVRMLRRVVQIVFFLGINAYIFAAWFGADAIMAFWKAVGEELPTLPIIAPLEAPFAVIAGSFDTLQREFTTGFFPFFTIGAMIIILTVLGRTACGWICPIGTIQDFVTLPNRNKHRPAPGTEKELRRVKAYIFLIVIFLVVWVGISKILGTSSALIELLGPFANAAFAPFNPAYIMFAAIPDIAEQGLWPSDLSELWFISLWGWLLLQIAFVIIVFIISYWIPRWFCRWICPAGWLYGLFSRDALIGIGRNPARCTPDTCNVCEMVCPMNIRIRKFPYQHMYSSDCIMCLDCKSHCPNDAIVIRFS